MCVYVRVCACVLPVRVCEGARLAWACAVKCLSKFERLSRCACVYVVFKSVCVFVCMCERARESSLCSTAGFTHT